MTNNASQGTVVFVLWEGLRVLSGVTTWVGVLRPHLEKRGWRVRTIVVDPSRDRAVLGEPDGAFVSLQQLEELLKQFSPGIVVLMNVLRQSGFGPVIASLNRRGSRLHAISVVHSDDHDEYYRHVPTIAPWVRHMIAVSPVVAQKTRAALPADAKVPVSMLACGVECPKDLQRHYQTHPVRLVYTGRLVQQQKRVLDLPVLTEALVRQGVDFTLTVYGDGTEEHQLREQMACHVRRGKVFFGGKIAHDDLLQRLTAFDAFVNVSEYEGTCVAMLEAMARGCVPVVTQASSGVEGLIESGKNGFYVPVGDMGGLAERIAELAGSSTLLERMGLAARGTVERGYAMDAYADSFAAILASVATSEPIQTSAEVDRVLACLLPVEANSSKKAADLRSYIDWRLDALRITARVERLVAPTLRWIKRTITRERGR